MGLVSSVATFESTVRQTVQGCRARQILNQGCSRTHCSRTSEGRLCCCCCTLQNTSVYYDASLKRFVVVTLPLDGNIELLYYRCGRMPGCLGGWTACRRYAPCPGRTAEPACAPRPCLDTAPCLPPVVLHEILSKLSTVLVYDIHTPRCVPIPLPHRADVLAGLNLSVPRTWEEVVAVAQALAAAGADGNGDGQPDFPFCFDRRKGACRGDRCRVRAKGDLAAERRKPLDRVTVGCWSRR